MIHIICIKWGDKFSSEYVNKLFKNIQNNTSKEFLFTCFTDNSENINKEIEIKPIPYFTGDWFSKIGLYNKDLYNSSNQIFYFDLDTIIVGNLDTLLEYKGDFILLRDFYRPTGFGSGLMSWKPEAVDFMWKNYKNQKLQRGDQAWCEAQYPTADIWQELYPEKIISYKVHIRDSKKPIRARYNRKIKRTDHPGTLETASVICFHGNPLPHEVPEFWN